ncbi:MAG: PTS sugar transporter subunit IIA [Gemmatimonadales bacterium]
MSDALRGVLVSHGDVAQALAAAVHQITGETDALVPISNRNLGLERLQETVVEAIGPGPAVVFVDMPAGSCLQAVLRGVKGRTDVAVVAGVNLPMLLDFVYHRDLTAPAAAERAVATAGRSVRTISV